MLNERIFVALGGNQGDVLATLKEAVRSMHAWSNTHVVATSGLYRTPPVDAEGGPFINAVVELQSDFEPEPLLDALLALEVRLGRRRDIRPQGAADSPGQATHRARPIDLDLLMFGQRRLVTAKLILPHPRMHLRAFVLRPLADIAATLVLSHGKTVAQTLQALPDARDVEPLDVLAATPLTHATDTPPP